MTGARLPAQVRSQAPLTNRRHLAQNVSIRERTATNEARPGLEMRPKLRDLQSRSEVCLRPPMLNVVRRKIRRLGAEAPYRRPRRKMPAACPNPFSTQRATCRRCAHPCIHGPQSPRSKCGCRRIASRSPCPHASAPVPPGPATRAARTPRPACSSSLPCKRGPTSCRVDDPHTVRRPRRRTLRSSRSREVKFRRGAISHANDMVWPPCSCLPDDPARCAVMVR